MPRPGRCGRLCRDGAAPERDAGGSSVIRPLWVEVQEFRGWRARRRLPLDRRLTVIVGENRCGKSSTLNAIEWCLFGAGVEKAASGLGERADWEVRPRGAGESPTEVTLALATPEAARAISDGRRLFNRPEERTSLPAPETAKSL